MGVMPLNIQEILAQILQEQEAQQAQGLQQQPPQPTPAPAGLAGPAPAINTSPINLPPVEALAAAPAPSTGGGGLLAGIFGGGAGTGLEDPTRKALGKNALQAASRSLLESSGPDQRGFTPTTLQAISRALGAGTGSFEEGAGAAQAAAAQQATAQALTGGDSGIAAQIKRLRIVQNQALSAGNTDMVDSIEDIIQGLSPEEAFSVTSLGQGVGLRLNKRTGEMKLTGDAADTWTRTTVFDPESGEMRHAFFNKKDPTQFRVTDKIAEVPPGLDTTKMTEIQARALAAVTLADSSLSNFGDFFQTGGAEVITEEMIEKNPNFAAQFAIRVDPTGKFRGLTDVAEQEFALAAQQGIEAVGRFLTGAAITSSEEGRFRSLLPREGDAPTIVAKKLNDLRNLRDALAQIAGQGVVDRASRNRILRAQGHGEAVDIANSIVEDRPGVLTDEATDSGSANFDPNDPLGDL